jgi:hypothetical protein
MANSCHIDDKIMAIFDRNEEEDQNPLNHQINLSAEVSLIRHINQFIDFCIRTETFENVTAIRLSEIAEPDFIGALVITINHIKGSDDVMHIYTCNQLMYRAVGRNLESRLFSGNDIGLKIVAPESKTNLDRLTELVDGISALSDMLNADSFMFVKNPDDACTDQLTYQTTLEAEKVRRLPLSKDDLEECCW